MKKFLWFISTLRMILGLVTGGSSSVTRNVAEKDQQKGSETKQNKTEQDSYEAASVPVKKEEYMDKMKHPELVAQAIKPVSEESKKQNDNRIIKAKILKHINGDTFRVKLANGKVEDVRFMY
ncbi:hypothetical protein [Bacillus thuringiensis]|uniref:hypothetical protein n=1 Tax=Bacillus thuringiensis TaxID=1428 RepID=UPI000A3C3A07|nr:hypothetical protein [Bacillus thuringiensis]OUA56115.1 hypothetical protein BK781_19800 [Bacillus thuringiensis serovar aizawai]